MAEDSLFRVDAEDILKKGLSAMTRACDALTSRNAELEEELSSLSNELARSKDKLLVEAEERE